MVEWNGYSIGAVILVIAAIIAIIAGIVMFEEETTTTTQGTKWWIWLLIIGGIILLIIGVILGFVGRSKPSTMDPHTILTHHMSATHGLPPGHPYAAHSPYYPPYGASSYTHQDMAATYAPSSYPGYA